MSGIGPAARAELQRAGLAPDEVAALIRTALAEDLDGGVDLTTEATIAADHRSTVDFAVRTRGVLAGAAVAEAVFDIVSGGSAAVARPVAEGAVVAPGTVVLQVTGRTRDILTAERTALNLLGHLSGVATATRRWTDAIAGSGAVVRDTRKTLPGLRSLQKYAVRCGGGTNHRMGLYDGALVKDNHVAAARGVVEAYRAVRRRWPDAPVQVEVDSLEQLRAVLDAGATEVLLDNFTTDQLRTAVGIANGRARLEASGGLTVERAAAVAATGVDSIAVGALTHSAAVLDIGADYREEV